MAFLTVNGVTVPVAMGMQGQDKEIGSSATAFSGRYLSRRRAIQRTWDVKTTALTYAEAQALRGLVMGYGDAWSFDTDLYSGKGFGNNFPISAGSSIDASTFKYGAASLLLTVIGTPSESYIDFWPIPVKGGSEFTFGGWVLSNLTAGTAQINVYEYASDETTLLATLGTPNVANDAAWHFASGVALLNQSAAFIRLRVHMSSTPAGSVNFDDLFYAPGALSATQLAAIENHGVAFTPPPDILVEGDMVGGEAIICRAQPKTFEDAPHMPGDGSTWEAAGRALGFTLVERLGS